MTPCIKSACRADDISNWLSGGYVYIYTIDIKSVILSTTPCWMYPYYSMKSKTNNKTSTPVIVHAVGESPNTIDTAQININGKIYPITIWISNNDNLILRKNNMPNIKNGVEIIGNVDTNVAYNGTKSVEDFLNYVEKTIRLAMVMLPRTSSGSREAKQILLGNTKKHQLQQLVNFAKDIQEKVNTFKSNLSIIRSGNIS